MRIVMLEPLGISDEKLDRLAMGINAKGHELVAYDRRPGDEEDLCRRALDADAVIIANMPLGAGVIRRCPNLKMISVAFTGVDHVALEACRERGIVVCNAAGYSTQSVAELTFGLIFALLRNIVKCDSAVRQGGTKDGLIGFDLWGKTLGIVGTGAIGTRVAEIGRVFGLRILACSRSERAEVKALGAEYTDLDTLLMESDIVTLHVPLNDSTRGLIKADKLKLMKKTALLINTARGPVVDNAALADALNRGSIAGAGIDVFDMEPPLPEDYCLLGAPNTILTPHVAFATKEALERRADIAFDNIIAWLEGRVQNNV
ncbi:MAG TPA: 2-hydroxyacid dehydrogenase [Candidatus Atribacteria bacterium]|nr:2-hydroxyacid dehydrogenase [Candidatus Atribacteria bacterium]HPT79104.1 2-hydroxyacid dehydrogenase [Candidatus Atribacteria bacterium]